MYGVGGRTVPKLRMFDLSVVKQLSPDIIILEIGTYDLSHVGPEVVGSAIDDLVRLLLDNFAFRVVGVCHVIPRVFSCAATETSFLTSATALNQYTSAVLEELPNVFLLRALSWSFQCIWRVSCPHLYWADIHCIYFS